MAKPEISIVIPSYNGMPHLPKAVDSALRQRDCDFNIVVIDNASTDDTPAYLQSIDNERVRSVRQPALVSVFENWNRAIEVSDAPHVKLLCADDMIAPDACSSALAVLRSHPDAVLTGSRRRIIDDKGRTVMAARGLDGLKPENTRAEVARATAHAGTNVIGEPSAVVFRRDAVIAELPWSDRWPYVVDAEMYLRTLKQGTLVCTETVAADFRLTTSGWSNQLMSDQAEQFSDWLRELASDPSTGITDELLRTGMRRAKSNATKRRILYAMLRTRSRLW